MGIEIVILAALVWWGCGSETSGVSDGGADAKPDGPESPDDAPDASPPDVNSDGPVDVFPDGSPDGSVDVQAADGPVDVYVDGADGGADGTIPDGPGNNRVGINDSFAPLPFCSGRNIFTIQGNTGAGFCGEGPTVLYTFPISEDLSNVSASLLLELPGEIGGREVLPTTIRDAGPAKVILSMMNPEADNAATFLLVDLSTAEFLGPQVNATGLQIGDFPIGDPVPIRGLTDMALINGEFWGLLSNPNADGTYGIGFGLALPQNEAGWVDVGVEPNADGIVEQILSNNTDHFSFAVTDFKPTNLEALGNGLIAIQNGGTAASGTADSPASIDIASQAAHQLLAGRNTSLGEKQLTVLPRLAVDLSTLKAYPATATSLWEVNLNEGQPSQQETEIALSNQLEGQIAAVVIRNGRALVGDSDGKILFVDLSAAQWGQVVRTVEVGGGLTHLALDQNGHVFAAVAETVLEVVPHIVSIKPEELP